MGLKAFVERGKSRPREGLVHEPAQQSDPIRPRHYPLVQPKGSSLGCFGCGALLLALGVASPFVAAKPLLGVVLGALWAAAATAAFIVGRNNRRADQKANSAHAEARRQAAMADPEAQAAGLATAMRHEPHAHTQAFARLSPGSASEAARALVDGALAAAPDCPRALVFRQAFDLQRVWGATALDELSAEGALASVTIDLERLAARLDVRDFSVSVLPLDHAAQVDATVVPRRTRSVAIPGIPGMHGQIVETGPATIVPIRVWKSGEAVFVCAHPEAARLSGA